ncbi:MAG: DNA polymerase III subunit delta [Oscillospiraceae bacterium]
MASVMDKLTAVLEKPQEIRVFYLASTEEALLRQTAAKVCRALLAAEPNTDITVLEGPGLDVAAAIEAAGTVSFFGTRRIVEVRGLVLSAVNDKDMAELKSLFSELENAVLLVTVLYKDKKAAAAPKAKALLEAAARAGFAAELAKPTQTETLAYIRALAKEAGAQFEPGAAELLLERAGADRVLLQSEVEKLAAICNYGTIAKKLVQQYSVHNIEADVFELARLITSGKKEPAYQKLGQLFALRYEPIAVAAALAGTYVDMYRVRCGTEHRRQVDAVFKEMGYKGNAYRLQKAKENAARYSTAALGECVMCLFELDVALKSSALQEKEILVEAAVGRLMQIGRPL